MRVVLDTNVLVSGTISPNSPPSRVLDLWQQEEFELIASEDIFDEYQRVLHYPHLAIPLKRATSLMHKLRRDVILVEVVDNITGVSADPHDDKFIACGVAGGASYIVSGDEHLLAIREYKGILILPPALF